MNIRECGFRKPEFETQAEKEQQLCRNINTCFKVNRIELLTEYGGGEAQCTVLKVGLGLRKEAMVSN